MFSIKHLMDAIAREDGTRIWIEPIGLTRDMVQWCGVDKVLSQFGPPMELWRWYDEHPQGYEFFRARYHAHLERSPYRAALVELARAALHENFTLLHQGDDEQHNTATALYEYLSSLSAVVPPEE